MFPIQLSELRQYVAGAVDAVVDAPSTASCASYVLVTGTAGGTTLEMVCGSGQTRTLTVAAGREFYVDFTALTANTTAGPNIVGWR